MARTYLSVQELSIQLVSPASLLEMFMSADVIMNAAGLECMSLRVQSQACSAANVVT